MKHFLSWVKDYRLCLVAVGSAVGVVSAGVIAEAVLEANEPEQQGSRSGVTEGNPFTRSKPDKGVMVKNSAAGLLASQSKPQAATGSSQPAVPRQAAKSTVLQPGHPAPAQVSKTLPSCYGHLPYQEERYGNLASIGQFTRDNYQRDEYLNKTTAMAFLNMQAAARQDGVNLNPISGFRSAPVQQELFENQVQKLGSVEAASRLSSPPGYSEHHTGYAIDIGDQNDPANDLKLTFTETPAYRWLAEHAKNFGFELSFPENNRQRVSFEPWHWRYVGSFTAQQVFANARSPAQTKLVEVC